MPKLDEIVRPGDPSRRAEAARRIAERFLQGAANFRPDHVDLFDGVLIDLVPHTELAARTDLTDVIARRGDRAASTAERVASFWQARQPA
jgi:hypothetical protein